MTVTGPVEADRLGRVLVHEHVVNGYPGDELDPSSSYSRERTIEIAVRRMNQLRHEFGVRTFVDPLVIEMGRDPEMLAVVSQRSGMQIVCATGFYFEEIGIPFYWRNRTPEEIAELYLHEIRHGIGETGVRPGVIKIASGDPPGEHDRNVMRGAAIAAAESGLPVVSHCENAKGGDVQQEILAAAGVDLGRCLIGHQDQEPDAARVAALAKAGSFVGIDRVGFTLLAPEEQRADTVAALVREGLESRLCVSQDHCCALRSAKFPYAIPESAREHFAALEPLIHEQWFGRDFTHLFAAFLPMLAARGVDEATIERILVENPRRLLCGA